MTNEVNKIQVADINTISNNLNQKVTYMGITPQIPNDKVEISSKKKSCI